MNVRMLLPGAAAVGLVVGLAAGYWLADRGDPVVVAPRGGAAALATKAAGPSPPPTPEPAATARTADAREIQRLRRELAALTSAEDELRRSLATAERQRDEARGKLAAATAEKPRSGEGAQTTQELSDAFALLVDKGAAGYGSPEFLELAKQLEAAGAEGVAMMVEVLGSDVGGEAKFLAAGLLEKIGDPAALPALQAALAEDGDLLVRRSASHAIGAIGTEDALAPLRTAMTTDTDWGVRVNAAYGVAKQGGQDGIEMLEDAYFSPETPSEYRLAVLGALADVASPSTAGAFRRILSETEDPAYLMLAMKALAKMKDTGAIEDLQRLSNSDLPEVLRNAARRTIDEIQAAGAGAP